MKLNTISGCLGLTISQMDKIFIDGTTVAGRADHSLTRHQVKSRRNA